MPTRRGGFGNGGLDPFGGSRGGFSRYNITGDTIQSLAEYDAYAVAVAWSNGQASDDEYLASLQGLVDLSAVGSRERLAAENKLGDATYSIGRNKIANRVNAANTLTARVTALRELLAYDQQRLTGMQPDNEAYRSQVDRVAGVRVDIRQGQYSDLVNRVNAGKATTAQLLAMARDFRSASSADPDNDNWQQTVTTLIERVADEDLADAYQAFQHNRLSGAALLAKVNARMADLTPGSPAYKELARQKEDLQQRVSDDARTVRAATINGQRSAGKVTDSGYMAYLRDEYRSAVATDGANSSSAIEASNRLADFTFSVAEDKLRFDVQKGRAPVSRLIAFYKTARSRMQPNSERYRAITLAIDSLSRGGGSGGGGGGGGGGRAGSGSGYYLKQLQADSTLHDVLGTTKAPPDFADLFRLDISKPTSRAWWDNNLRSATAAFQRGDRTWTYYDKRGNAHELPFSPSMMSQFDQLNYTYTRNGLAGATSAKDAQYWTGKVITATKAMQQRGGQYTMDVYQKTFGDIERAKQSALAGGRFAEYVNLTREQADLARFILGGTLDPNASTNPYLTADQRNRIGRDLAKIAPLQQDANQPGYNPDGDLALQMIDDGRIRITVDSDGNAVNGSLDPNAGYLTQRDDGTIGIVESDINAPGGSVYDPAIDRDVPAYLKATSAAVIRVNGQDIEVRQPTIVDGAFLPVYVSKTGASSAPGPSSQTAFDIPGGLEVGRGGAPIPGAAVSVDPYVVNGQPATVGLKTFTTREGNTLVRWVSLDGRTWVRYVPGEVAPPRIVIGSDYSFDGAKWTQDGKEVDATKVLGSAHWWGPGDSQGAGAAWGLGGPGMTYTTREAKADGRIDTRPTWMFKETKASGAREFDGDPTSVRESYFTMDADVAAAEQAARDAYQTAQRQTQFDREAGAIMPSTTPPVPSYFTPDPNGHSSDLLPVVARAKIVTLQRAAGKGALIGDDPTRDIGLKPSPSPTLRPSPTPTLSPVSSSIAAPSALKPIALPKITYGGNTGAAGRAKAAAATAAAKKKAAATAAAKKKAPPMTTTPTGPRPTGHGALESDY